MNPRYAVEFLPNLRLPMRDGVELSANLWRPVPRRPGETFPAVLEYLPYRKDDWRFHSDQARMTCLAQRGFAGCRVDIRGTDGVELVAWLAAQPWCNGRVGMWGISYGGFTAIQVAMRRPPALKAIAPMYATDDRYRTDVHYVGGCLTASDLAQYAVGMVAMNALPPKTEYAGADWAAWWKARLEQTPPWLIEWLKQQSDGAYWRHNSLAPDYAAIVCPILHFAGWADGYSDAALRMQANCAEQKVILGPWAHLTPEHAWTGPNIDWLDELVRFFDRYLKGIENGWEATPAVRVYRETFTPPEAFPRRKNGGWESFPAFPAPGAMPISFHLDAGAMRLTTAPVEAAAALTYAHRPAWGTGGQLCSGAGAPPNGLARDLRPEEALMPTFTSAPLEAPLDVFGFPEAVLYLSCTAPTAAAVVRLADVAPDGVSALVAWGALNLTRRAAGAPQPLTPGEVYEIALALKGVAYRFQPGHRVRLTVSSAHWPLIWPTPYPAENTLHCGPQTPSRLILPAAPPGPGPAPLAAGAAGGWAAFKETPPELDYPGSNQEIAPRWRITEDVLAGTVTVATYQGDQTRLPDGTEIFTDEALEMTASHADPARARLHNVCVYRLTEAGQVMEARSSGSFRSTLTDFHLDIQLTVTLNGAVFFHKAWLESVPRLGM